MKNSFFKLRGIVPPLITPLKEDESLDLPGLERLVTHVVNGGVHGLFVLGTTGEGPGLPYSVRREVVKRVCALAAGRVPVLVSVTDTVFEESVALSVYAAECGAGAVVVAPPYYFPAKQDELWTYFQRLAASIPIPFYLYNLPGITKVSIGEDVVRRCLELSNCRGLKDSSGDMHYFKRMQRVISQTGAHSLFIGPEELLADSLFAGGDGGISGGANVWPEIYTAIYAHALAGEWTEARAGQIRVMEMSRRIYSIGGYGPTVTKALKSALEASGICGLTMAPPNLSWGQAECTELRRELVALGLNR